MDETKMTRCAEHDSWIDLKWSWVSQESFGARSIWCAQFQKGKVLTFEFLGRLRMQGRVAPVGVGLIQPVCSFRTLSTCPSEIRNASPKVWASALGKGGSSTASGALQSMSIIFLHGHLHFWNADHESMPMLKPYLGCCFCFLACV